MELTWKKHTVRQHMVTNGDPSLHASNHGDGEKYTGKQLSANLCLVKVISLWNFFQFIVVTGAFSLSLYNFLNQKKRSAHHLSRGERGTWEPPARLKVSQWSCVTPCPSAGHQAPPSPQERSEYRAHLQKVRKVKESIESDDLQLL